MNKYMNVTIRKHMNVTWIITYHLNLKVIRVCIQKKNYNQCKNVTNRKYLNVTPTIAQSYFST